ncbi:MAG: hypothetical protein WCK89_23705, partial [bacterium]
NATSVKFLMGTAIDSGNGSAWRNNWVPDFVVGGVKKLRSENPYLYPGVFGDLYYWQFTGLNAAKKYNLIAFGVGAATGHSANTVDGSQDAEGDWNWSEFSPDENGKITGYFHATGGTPGLYGFQIEDVTKPTGTIILFK